MAPFDALEEEFFESYLQRYPQYASYIGYTNHDTEMPSGKLENYKKGIEQNKYFLTQFQNLDESQLNFDEKITRRLAIHRLQIWLFMSERCEHYLKDPDCASGISSALDPLFMRKGAERFYPLLARLEKVPQYIEDFKTRVKTPAGLWTEMAIESADGVTRYLHTIEKAAQKEIPSEDAEEIQNHVQRAEKSLKDYTEFLRNVLPSAVTPWHMDRETFDALLHVRKLPYTADEILALGWKWYNGELERLHTLAEAISPGKSVEEVTHLIKDTHPSSFEEVLKVYKKYLENARKFVIENDILTLPEGESFLVEAMPEYLRHLLPFAACFQAPIVGEDRTGYLRVTPHQDPAFLREHTEARIINTCIHEGYPGHHIHFWCTSLHPHRIRWLTTFLSAGPEMVEGWAHYCEELMMEMGFVTTKEYQFMQSRGVLWRAARIILDVQLSRGEMTFEEAVQFLENMGMEHMAASGEVKWYTTLPSYPLSYLLGKHMVKALKEKVKKMMNSFYTNKFFHDTLMYEGAMPLTFFEDVFKYKIKMIQQKWKNVD